MATLVPATLIETKAFGNGAANVATWRYQNTLGASTYGICRTLVVDTPSAARHVTIEEGPTAADTVSQHLLDVYPLTASVPLTMNWWVTIPNNSYFEGFADNTDINGAAYGYTWS